MAVRQTENYSVIDLFDILAVTGLILLGAAVAIVGGWVAVLAYAGVVLIVAGVVGAVFQRGAL